MTLYETCRVGLHICQVIVTASIPIVAVLLSEFLKRRRRNKIKEEKKYGK